MKTQPQAPLDKFVCAFIKGFYVYAISRRLAGLLINFEDTDWSRHKSLIRLQTRAEVLKIRMQDFIDTDWSRHKSLICIRYKRVPKF